MARNEINEKRKENNDVGEAPVPPFLGITLWVARALATSPARLRWRRGWRVAASPSFAKLQRLIICVTNAMVLSAIILEFLSEPGQRVRLGDTTLHAGVYITESSLLVVIYSLGVWTAPRKLKGIIFVLQQTHKIKTSLQRKKSLKYSETKHVLLILYIIWQFITCFSMYDGLTWFLDENVFLSSLYSVYIYQLITIVFFQLQFSMLVIEICATLTLLNDELEVLLQSIDTLVQLESGDEYIHRLNLNYDAICGMLRRVDKNNGPFLLLVFSFLCIHLLITPYNLIASILCNACEDEVERYIAIAKQFNWCLLHLSHLVMLVEPCHWLQEQRARTGRLLIKLVSKADRCKLDRTYLDPFLLQTQLHDCTLAPCGVFTITRPLMASIIGGVTTYLIIMVQFQSVTELV